MGLLRCSGKIRTMCPCPRQICAILSRIRISWLTKESFCQAKKAEGSRSSRYKNFKGKGGEKE
jgi:hypothetical protein